eukprot:gnl/MRDRNA2_/MRDRNA2_244470_c0_seq1.p1 gnl/MRDRNA2_/MRDRNA2_244470_c0~~gnl/MRDRNA2_/MRDRNA2_244470_c0_seq1.p1  ORF type:complete len:281 (+),score=53.43 gnl/MRDRNA2_/MRDRNA2_244470_c0_seq1:29-844(+)
MEQSLPQVEGKFEYDLFRQRDFEGFFALSGEIFTKQNALVKRLGITREDWHKFEVYDSSGFMDSGLSFVVRDKEAGDDLVAFLAVQVANFAKPPPNLEELGIENIDAFKLLFEVMKTAFAGAYVKRCYPGCCAAFQSRTLRVAAGGTKKGYEGKGLQQRMREMFLTMAEEQGYDRIIVETISPATEHIWTEKFDFDILGQVTFAEFKRKDGTGWSFPLEGLDGRGSILEKVLRKRPCVDVGFWCPFFGCGIVCKHACCGRACKYMCCCFNC